MRSSVEASSVGRYLVGCYRFLASYQLAVTLIAVLALLLAWATLYEHWFYSPALMKYAIYDRWWFHGLLALVGVNVILAAVRRWPWRRSQVGFLLAHVGIVALLAGCIVQSWYGVEATLRVYEGHSEQIAVRSDQSHLEVDVFAASSGPLRYPEEQFDSYDPKSYADAWKDPKSEREFDFQFDPGPYSWRRFGRMTLSLKPSEPKKVKQKQDDADAGPAYGAIPVFPWALAPRDEGRTYSADGIEVQTLDYYADAKLRSPKPLKLKLRTPEIEEVSLRAESPTGAMRGMNRAAYDEAFLADGTQLTYSTAKRWWEADAMADVLPEGDLGRLGQVALWIDGSTHRLALDELIARKVGVVQEVQRLEAERAAPTPDRSIEAIDAEIAEQMKRLRRPIPDTPLSVAMDALDLQTAVVILDVYWDDEPVGQMRLYANLPVANWRLDMKLYGAYWVAAEPGDALIGEEFPEAEAMIASMQIAGTAKPRIELMQAADGTLRYRAWSGQRKEDGKWDASVGTLDSASGGKVSLAGKTIQIDVEQYDPNSWPAPGVLEMIPRVKEEKETLKSPWVKLRATVGAEPGETFWLKKRLQRSVPYPPNAPEHYYMLADGRVVEIQWRDDLVDLEFGIYVRRFTQRLDPGSSKPAEFTSVVDVLKPDGTVADESYRDVVITMNRPPEFRGWDEDDPSRRGKPYRVYQSSFDAPVKPDDPLFDFLSGTRVLEGEDRPRDEISQSVFTVNYDPGRGLKYLGCLLMVFGTMIMFFGKKSKGRANGDNASSESAEGSSTLSGGGGKALGLLLAVLAAFGASGGDASADDLDWSTWRALPVFEDGRIMPLGTFARRTVEDICDDSTPFLKLTPADRERVPEELRQRIEALIPDGGRRFSSEELLFAWMAEPELWDHIPFLKSGPYLRADLMGFKPKERADNWSEYVSPATVNRSQRLNELVERAMELAREKKTASREEAEKTVLADEKVKQLLRSAPEVLDRHDRYVRLTVAPFHCQLERLTNMAGSIDVLRQDLARHAEALKAMSPPLADPRAADAMTSHLETVDDALSEFSNAVERASSPSDLAALDDEAQTLYQTLGQTLVGLQALATLAQQEQGTSSEEVDQYLSTLGSMYPICSELQANAKVFRVNLRGYTHLLWFVLQENSEQWSRCEMPWGGVRGVLSQDARRSVDVNAWNSQVEQLLQAVDALKTAREESGETQRTVFEAVTVGRHAGTLASQWQGRQAMMLMREMPDVSQSLASMTRNVQRIGMAAAKMQMQREPDETLIEEQAAVIAKNAFELNLAWNGLGGVVGKDGSPDGVSLDGAAECEAALGKAGGAQRAFTEMIMTPRQEVDIPSVVETDLELNTLCDLSFELATQAATLRDAAFQEDALEDLTLEQRTLVRRKLHAWAYQVREFADACVRLQMKMFDGPESVHVVPGLDAKALGSNRQRGEDISPWLSLPLLVFGSDATIRRFARPDLPVVEETAEFAPGMTLLEYLQTLEDAHETGHRPIREAWTKAVAAYADRGSDDRAQRFNEGMTELSSAIRTLGEEIEPLRHELDIPARHERILEQTAYPTSLARIQAELRYEDSNPFLWTWIFAALGGVGFIAALVVSAQGATAPDATNLTERWLLAGYWTGMGGLVGCFAAATFGFSLRCYITGLVAVSSMFETVVFVALLIALFGICFALQPIAGTGMRRAWELTSLRAATGGGTNGIVLPIVRIAAFMVGIFAVTWVSYVAPSPSAAEAWSTLAASLGTLNGLIDFIVVGCLIGVLAWYVSRLAMAACIAVATTPAAIRREGASKPTPMHLYVGLAAALAAMLMAMWAFFNQDQFDPEIKTRMAVLRDNFWLVFHVFTIAVGYAAGALCWVLGMIMLTSYVVAPYRTEPLTEASAKKAFWWDRARLTEALRIAKKQRRRPMLTLQPDLSEQLTPITRTVMQVAALFILIGTITGARWADYSWGRFWSWDPKELWALITLLVYLAILHAYYARWFRTFGLAAGAVAGAIAIAMTWYGINYVISSGRHAYGAGGGADSLFIFDWRLACFWAFMAACAICPIIAGIAYVVRGSRINQ